MTLVEFDAETTAALEAEDWATWLVSVIPSMCEAPFAKHHVDFWDWLWAIEPGVRPETFVGAWARGGAKSSSAEGGCVALGARGRRRYALYVCGTQEQADDHVGNVAALLEAPEVELWYPEMAERDLGKFGNSKGWRRNRLRTAAGFTVDALGLDTAARGVKLENQRPDLLIIDDIDDPLDSPRTVAKKIDAITKKLLPAGAPDLAVLAIQNLVHRDGVFSRLVDGRAKFLARRRVSGPIPAVYGMRTMHSPEGRDVIVEGEASWVGQPLWRCQEQIDDWGLTSFLSEAQHEVDAHEGALWRREQLAALRRERSVELARVVVAVDPSGGSGPDADAQGIVTCGKDGDGSGWVLEDATVTLPPRGWGDVAARQWLDWEAEGFVCELNYGGDMVVEVVSSAVERLLGSPIRNTTSKHTPNGRVVTVLHANGRAVVFHVVSASKGKHVRAQPVAALYGRPDEEVTWSTARVHHAGHFVELEDEMTGFRADATWSPNRMDAAVWGLTHLMIDQPSRGRRRTSL